MSYRLGAALLAASVLLPATALAGQDAVNTEVSQNTGVTDVSQIPTDREWKGWIWVDPVEDLAEDAARADISKILFVNPCRGGCTITPGNNDARANTSSIASGTSNLSEFAHGDAVFNEVIDCIKEVYSPYDVEIVTEDPGEMFHHEAILAGTPDQLGLQGNIGGIAPSSCSPLNNVISYSFANGYIGRSVEEMCWTVAQESAHSFGLPNHVFNCLDPMTYLDGCGRKYFRNENYQCGEFSPGPCNCSGASQNSHVELRNVFGDGVPPAPPQLQILLPREGDAVADNFTIFFEATDERLVEYSELYINGTLYGTVNGQEFPQDGTYDITAPALPDGNMIIEIKSYNDLGSESVASINVTKGAPCASADTCFDFQQCNAGRCEYPPADRELGQSCDVDQQCLEGVCAVVDGDQGCAAACNPSVPNSCGDGFDCEQNDTGGFVCWPEGSDGGCCSVAGTKKDPVPWTASILFLLGMVMLRRRSRS